MKAASATLNKYGTTFTPGAVADGNGPASEYCVLEKMLLNRQNLGNPQKLPGATSQFFFLNRLHAGEDWRELQQLFGLALPEQAAAPPLS